MAAPAKLRPGGCEVFRAGCEIMRNYAKLCVPGCQMTAGRGRHAKLCDFMEVIYGRWARAAHSPEVVRAVADRYDHQVGCRQNGAYRLIAVELTRGSGGFNFIRRVSGREGSIAAVRGSPGERRSWHEADVRNEFRSQTDLAFMNKRPELVVARTFGIFRREIRPGFAVGRTAGVTAITPSPVRLRRRG